MASADIVFRDGFDVAWIESIIDLHNKTEMKRSADFREKFIKAYSQRFAVVTGWHGHDLIAFGTMISDGEMYSSIFDLVVDPAFQKKGVGQKVVEMLIAKAPATCLHLTSTFGSEKFYEKLGFKKHKTAYAKYPWKSEYLIDVEI